MLIDNNLSFYKGILYEDELFTFLLFMQSKIVVHLPETLYTRRIRKNSIMNVRIKAHNFLSITVVASEMIKFYLSTSESDYKNITRICINRILFYVKDVYQRLSVKDKIALDKELKRFENVLQFNNYLDSQEIKQACLNIRLVQFRDIIKKMLPRKLKTAMKNIAANE